MANPEVRGSIFEIDIANIDGATLLGDFGAGFTRATANSFQNAAADANTTIRPIVGFPQGHGSSPIEELAGNYVMVSKELAGAVVDTSNVPTFTVDNEFRKIGLLRDPLNDEDGNRATTASIDQTLRIPISEATDTLINTLDFRTGDFTLFQAESGASGKIVDRFSFVEGGITRFQIRLTEVVGEFSPDLNSSMEIFPNGSTTAVRTGITGEGGGSPRTGGLRQFSGEMIYVEHRVAVRRSADQTENVRLIIEF